MLVHWPDEGWAGADGSCQRRRQQNERAVQMTESPVGTLDDRKHSETQTTEMVQLDGKPALSPRHGLGSIVWEI